MGANVVADAGFVVALLSARDTHHAWAVAMCSKLPPPWRTCEAVVSEAYHLLGERGAGALLALLRRRALVATFDLTANLEPVLKTLAKYRDLGASLSDVCLVRMTELLVAPVVLTTDEDFRHYRRHGRQLVPCLLPR